jgi:hypothetical protein
MTMFPYPSLLESVYGEIYSEKENWDGWPWGKERERRCRGRWLSKYEYGLPKLITKDNKCNTLLSTSELFYTTKISLRHYANLDEKFVMDYFSRLLRFPPSTAVCCFPAVSPPLDSCFTQSWQLSNSCLPAVIRSLQLLPEVRVSSTSCTETHRI